MKRKAAAALVALGMLGVGVPLAWGASTGAVPIEDLTLVEETESDTAAVNADSQPNRDYGRRDYGYRDYGRRDYGRRDYGYRDYGRRDYGRRDYGYRDYGRRDYGYRDYGRRDYGRRDHGYRGFEGAAPGTGIHLPAPRIGTDG